MKDGHCFLLRLRVSSVVVDQQPVKTHQLMKSSRYYYEHDHNWGPFYASALHLHLCFESLHICTNRKVNANTNAWLMQTQMHTRRNYTTTVQNRFANTMLRQCKRKYKRIKGAPAYFFINHLKKKQCQGLVFSDQGISSLSLCYSKFDAFSRGCKFCHCHNIQLCCNPFPRCV